MENFENKVLILEEEFDFKELLNFSIDELNEIQNKLDLLIRKVDSLRIGEVG